MSSLQLSPQEAAQHLLNRRRARTDVVQYAGIIEVPGRPLNEDPDCELFEPVETNLAAHHILTLRAMERTAARRYGRLMIFMPPGAAKTTYASVVFPSHYLGAADGRRLLLTSYGDLPAKRMGRRTRSIIRQPRYQRLLGAALSKDSSAAEQFVLTNGSEYLASSMLGSVTSYRADGAIIDDPVKGRAEANSEPEQDKSWDAYVNDIASRLVPGGWLVLIMTRWAEGDLAGRILPEGWKGDSGMFKCRDGRTWEVLCLQAKCQTLTDPLGRNLGEYLWPQWFDPDHWTQFEREAQTWASLYQQLPAPLEGALFKPDQIQYLDAEPAGVRWVRGWDLAGTKDDGDYTASVKMGAWNGRPVIADATRFRGSPDEVERAIVATASRDGQGCEIHLPQDPGQAGKHQVQYFTSKLIGYKVKSSPETGDKVTRASPLAAQVNVGNVYMVRSPSWNRQFTEELRVFPNGANDDQVDAASRAFSAIVVARRSFFG